MKARTIISAISTLIVAAFLAGIVVQKERLLSRSDTVFFKLAPVDPRSLMQGDYMALRYELANDLELLVPTTTSRRHRGLAVITLDSRRIAVRVRPCPDGEAPGPGERLIRYSSINDRISIGAESFFFQEGHAVVYGKARYGELAIDDSGSSILVELRDERLTPLAPEKPRQDAAAGK